MPVSDAIEKVRERIATLRSQLSRVPDSDATLAAMYRGRIAEAEHLAELLHASEPAQEAPPFELPSASARLGRRPHGSPDTEPDPSASDGVSPVSEGPSPDVPGLWWLQGRQIASVQRTRGQLRVVGILTGRGIDSYPLTITDEGFGPVRDDQRWLRDERGRAMRALPWVPPVGCTPEHVLERLAVLVRQASNAVETGRRLRRDITEGRPADERVGPTDPGRR